MKGDGYLDISSLTVPGQAGHTGAVAGHVHRPHPGQRRQGRVQGPHPRQRGQGADQSKSGAAQQVTSTFSDNIKMFHRLNLYILPNIFLYPNLFIKKKQ